MKLPEEIDGISQEEVTERLNAMETHYKETYRNSSGWFGRGYAEEEYYIFLAMRSLFESHFDEFNIRRRRQCKQ